MVQLVPRKGIFCERKKFLPWKSFKEENQQAFLCSVQAHGFSIRTRRSWPAMWFLLFWREVNTYFFFKFFHRYINIYITYHLYRSQDVLVHRIQGRPQDCLQAICQVLFLYANVHIFTLYWTQYFISCQVLHFFVWNNRYNDWIPFLACSSAAQLSPETTNCSPWRSFIILLR